MLEIMATTILTIVSLNLGFCLGYLTCETITERAENEVQDYLRAEVQRQE